MDIIDYAAKLALRPSIRSAIEHKRVMRQLLGHTLPTPMQWAGWRRRGSKAKPNALIRKGVLHRWLGRRDVVQARRVQRLLLGAQPRPKAKYFEIPIDGSSVAMRRFPPADILSTLSVSGLDRPITLSVTKARKPSP